MRTKDDARRLFLQESFGVLSTISLDVHGYPFGSVTPYCADDRGRPIIYISTIAQHTKNIAADPHVSLTVVERAGDADEVQAMGRLTCLGDAKPVDRRESRVGERYFRHFPSARQYQDTHDFAFFRLELVRIRYIGGFGQIYWVEPGEFELANPFSAAQESQIVEHMNRDHRDALNRYAGGDATMSGIDAEGFDLLLKGASKRRVAFDVPVRNMGEARQALIALTKRPA